MELLRWKARLSVLWLTAAILIAATLPFAIVQPRTDLMAGMISGMQITEGMIVLWALEILFPLLVAILCLTLNGAANRWVNFVLGIVLVVGIVEDIAETVIRGEEKVMIGMWLLGAGTLVVSAFIIWFAWKWPKLEA